MFDINKNGQTPEWMNKLLEYAVIYGTKIIIAILILVIGQWVAKIAGKLVETAMHKAKVDNTLISFAKSAVSVLIIIFTLIAALSQLGIQTTSLIALLGAAGLAIGLALQGSLSNFAAGVILMLSRYFKVGDTVEAGGVTGVVKGIQLFNTIFLTSENKIVILPNSKITGDKIIIHESIEEKEINS